MAKRLSFCLFIVRVYFILLPNYCRFWRCAVTGTGESVSIEWVEWNMVSKSRQSSISLPGVPLHVSCAYSGRIACAYLPPNRATVVTPWSNADATTKFMCKVAVFECESSGGSQWAMCEPVTVEDSVSTDFDQLGSQLIDQARVTKAAHARTTTKQLASAFSHENLHQDVPDTSGTVGGKHHAGPDTATDAFKSVSSMLYVPSLSTLHSIKSQKFSKRGISVKQRRPVQIDWVSREDGSFMLTVALGSKVRW